MPNNEIKTLNFPNISHRYWLDIMNNSKYLDYQPDCYGNGELVELLETRVAKLLGKPKALFFHKGVIAQLCALKVAAENKACNNVILHPNCHIAANEENGYQALMGLRGIELGTPHQPFDCEAVKNVAEKVGTLTVELPLRQAGFKLTPWQDLLQMRDWAKQNNTHFHIDGARIWESTHHYNKSLEQIASLSDSVYVSFYKGIGGLSGAMLAGDEDFINQCYLWRKRMGAELFSAFPMLITALEGLDKNLHTIPQMVERAIDIAAALNSIDNFQVDVPHTNGFLIFVKAPLAQLNKKILALKSSLKMKLINDFVPTAISNIQSTEIQIGVAAEQLTNQQIIDYFKALTADRPKSTP
jgi:threonine aldolase